MTRHQPLKVAAVEIEAAVLRASSFFDAFNHKPLGNPAVRPVVAARFVSELPREDKRWDVATSAAHRAEMTGVPGRKVSTRSR